MTPVRALTLDTASREARAGPVWRDASSPVRVWNAIVSVRIVPRA